MSDAKYIDAGLRPIPSRPPFAPATIISSCRSVGRLPSSSSPPICSLMRGFRLLASTPHHHFTLIIPFIRPGSLWMLFYLDYYYYYHGPFFLLRSDVGSVRTRAPLESSYVSAMDGWNPPSVLGLLCCSVSYGGYRLFFCALIDLHAIRAHTLIEILLRRNLN